MGTKAGGDWGGVGEALRAVWVVGVGGRAEGGGGGEGGEGGGGGVGGEGLGTHWKPLNLHKDLHNPNQGQKAVSNGGGQSAGNGGGR